MRSTSLQRPLRIDLTEVRAVQDFHGEFPVNVGFPQHPLLPGPRQTTRFRGAPGVRIEVSTADYKQASAQ